MPWYRPVSWARFDTSFELCFWWRCLPALLFAVDWNERLTFSMERYR